jgi:hypothetical protein
VMEQEEKLCWGLIVFNRWGEILCSLPQGHKGPCLPDYMKHKQSIARA